MINEKIRELYQQTEKTAPKTLENQTRGVWFKDPFVKKIIVALVVIMAISVIAEIVFLLYESSQIGNTINMFNMRP